jgi:hypothetical protein
MFDLEKAETENIFGAIGAQRTKDTGKIRLGGACRPPVATAHISKIRVERRLPMETTLPRSERV